MINKLIDSYYFPNNFFDTPRCNNGANFVFSDKGDHDLSPIPTIYPVKFKKSSKDKSIILPEEIYASVDSYKDIVTINRNHCECACLFKEDKVIFHKDSNEIEIVRPKNVRGLIKSSEDQIFENISNIFISEIFSNLIYKLKKKNIVEWKPFLNLYNESIKLSPIKRFDLIKSQNLEPQLLAPFISAEQEIYNTMRLINLKDQKDRYVNLLKQTEVVISDKNK